MNIELNSNNLPLNSILSINSQLPVWHALNWNSFFLPVWQIHWSSPCGLSVPIWHHWSQLLLASLFAPLAIYFLPIWHPFYSPYGYYSSQARMTILLSPYDYSSQARMAFNLTRLVGPSGLLFDWPVWPFVFPVWHPVHQPVNTYMHAHSPHKVVSSDHPNLLLFPDLHTLHIDTPCTSFNTAQK